MPDDVILTDHHRHTTSNEMAAVLRRTTANGLDASPPRRPPLRPPPYDPPDGGYGWVIVLASFLLFTIVGGGFFSFGVLYVAFLKAFNASKADTAWIGSLFFGVGIVSNAISLALSNKFGHRAVVIAGGIMAACGLVMCSFTTTIQQIYFTYGVFTSLAFWLLPVPALALIGKYFKKRLAMAIGLALAGTGAGQFLLSLLIQILLDTYGWRGTLIVLGGISLNICVAGALFRPIEAYHRNKRLSQDRDYKELDRTLLNHSAVSATVDGHSKKIMAARYEVIEEVSEETEDSDLESVDGIVFTIKCPTDSVPRELDHVPQETVVVEEDTTTARESTKCCCTGLCQSSCCQTVRTIFSAMYDVTLFKNPVFLLTMLTVFGYSASQYAIIAHVVKRGRDYGIPSFQSSTLPAMMGLTQCFGRVFWGVGGSLLKVKPYLLYGAGMGIGGIAAIVSIYIRNYEGQLAFVLIFGLCMACYIPIMPVVLHYFLGAERLDHSLSMAMQMQGLAAMLGSPFAGWMRDIQGEYDGAFYAVGSLLIVSSILAFSTPCVEKHLLEKKKEKQTLADPVVNTIAEHPRTLSMSQSLATLDHLTAV